MRIALAQLNPTVGDLKGNCRLILEAVRQARTARAELLAVPELAISGYPPRDLLLRRGFVVACDEALQSLAELTDEEFGIVVGHPSLKGSTGGEIFNAASLLWRGKIETTVRKILLPNYDVFDEKRYFHVGPDAAPVEFRGQRLGLHICEDAWWGEPNTFYHVAPYQLPDPVAQLAEQGVDLFINVSASPFEASKPDRRRRIAARHVAAHRRPFVFVNQVGANDDLVFDGNSFVLDADGNLVEQLEGFRSRFSVIDTEKLSPISVPQVRSEKLVHDALVIGLGDYMRKSGFADCVLGLSGGIDSALAACVAAEAVGPEHVHGLAMPSRYSSEHSIRDALALAQNLGIDHEVIPIDDVRRAYEGLPVIGDDLSSDPAGLADQNLQARIRGAIVMTRSNRRGWMALATGNKSELAVGYCTLYGDMAGGFAVLSDLYKRDVYAVASYVNDAAGREIIPQNILTKAPSAELAPNQFDQDTLPPYPVLDAILRGLIDEEQSPAELATQFPIETVRWVVRRLDRNEFKRRQMPPGIKLSQRAFGTGRRMPMAARVFEALPDEGGSGTKQDHQF